MLLNQQLFVENWKKVCVHLPAEIYLTEGDVFDLGSKKQVGWNCGSESSEKQYRRKSCGCHSVSAFTSPSKAIVSLVNIGKLI